MNPAKDRITKNVLLEEARESFFQLENLASNIDNKAFGLVAIDSLLITISWYFFNNTNMDFWSIPIAFCSASLFFMLLCAWPRTRRRQDTYETVRKYIDKPSEEVINHLIVNYATWSAEFGKRVYDKKAFLLCIGFAYTCLGIFIILILLYQFDSLPSFL